jgi:peroxiredoxin
MAFLWIAVVLAWIVLAGCVWAIYQLVAQNGRLLLRVEALERHLGDLHGLTPPAAHAAQDATQEETWVPPGIVTGTVLHDFELPDLHDVQHLRSDWLGKRFLMIFVSPYCRHSRALVAALAEHLAHAADDGLAIMLVSTGSLEENRRLIERTSFKGTVLIQEEMEVGELFQVPATPMAYLVDEDGRTASPLASGRSAILHIASGSGQPFGEPLTAERVQAETTPAPVNGARYRGGLGPGDIAPPFDLPDLDGGRLALDRYRGQPVLLIFTEPDHAPCNEIVPGLTRVQESRSGRAVVVVARGDRETNRAWAAGHCLSAPVGVQHRWDVSRDYGLLAVPAAYLIDKRGFIEAPLALGADAILELSEHIAALVHT